MIVARQLTTDDALKAAVAAIERARAAEVAHPALARYAEIRNKYTAEHDAQHHHPSDFADAALALLLGDHDKLQRSFGTTILYGSDPRQVHAMIEPANLWRLGSTGPLTLPYEKRVVEAAALLLCMTDHPALEAR